MAFDDAACAYELLCDRDRLGRELPLLTPWAGGGRAIDLACGLGDHLAGLAAADAIVSGTGLDIAPAMVARATARHPDPRLAFRCGDLRSADVSGHDRILCLGNAMACLPSTGDAVAALRRLAAALPDDGRLLVQVVNPQRGGPDHGCVVRRRADATLVKTVVREADRSLLSLTLHRRDGDGWRSHTLHQELLHLDAATLAAACPGAVIAGGLDGRPFDAATSPDVVLDFRR